jgi:hypothetical protein
VLSTVELDHELGRMTDEVGDVVLDRHLSTKTRAVQAMTAELGPEDSLCIGRVLAERSRIRAQSVRDLPVRMFRIDH